MPRPAVHCSVLIEHNCIWYMHVSVCRGGARKPPKQPVRTPPAAHQPLCLFLHRQLHRRPQHQQHPLRCALCIRRHRHQHQQHPLRCALCIRRHRPQHRLSTTSAGCSSRPCSHDATAKPAAAEQGQQGPATAPRAEAEEPAEQEPHFLAPGVHLINSSKQNISTDIGVGAGAAPCGLRML